MVVNPEVSTPEIAALAFLVLIVALLAIYAIRSTILKRRPVSRTRESDEKQYDGRTLDLDEITLRPPSSSLNSSESRSKMKAGLGKS